jgi:hypothetical protein
MPSTIFDWIVRTAMLAMAGLVTLSILGAIATMTNDAGSGFPGGDRALIEADRAREREAAQAPTQPQPAEAGNSATAVPAQGQGGTVVAARPAPEDRQARWLEAIAYALLAIAGIGALAVLMLWQAVRELKRIGGPQR